jgi:replicative DNA helicase
MDLTRSKYSKKRKEKPSIDLSTMVYGKVPPQAVELEKAILGAIMLEKSAIDIAAELLKPECFYLESNQLIYRAILSLNSKHQPVDLLTVGNQLNDNGELELVGGPFYITQLTNAVVSSANIEAHAKIVKEKYIARRCIQIAGEMIGAAYENGTDVFNMISDHEQAIAELTTGTMGKSATPMDVALVQGIQRLEEIKERGEVMTGIPSGFAGIDQVTYGWQNSDFIILAARPAVGKTAFALNLARNAAINNIRPTPVLFISLEMSLLQLTNRIMSSESEVWLEKISRGNVEKYDMQQIYGKGVEKLAKAPIFIDDTAALNVIELRAKARRLCSKQGIGLIIIDYLQLMSGTGSEGNREQQISTISRNLKILAKELNIPIIALSQLSRAVETRQGEKKMPQLSDLRESGAIEQDADMVMFLYRPEYYDITSNETGESTKGETHVKIAKHRNGVLETIKLRADLAIQKFHSWDGPDFEPQKPTRNVEITEIEKQYSPNGKDEDPF